MFRKHADLIVFEGYWMDKLPSLESQQKRFMITSFCVKILSGNQPTQILIVHFSKMGIETGGRSFKLLASPGIVLYLPREF